MDKLYALIQSRDWDDDNFVLGYDRVMGTTIAVKDPLTISAQNALFKPDPAVSDLVLDTLSSLLIGMSKERHDNQPARVIHQSLREFVVVRARNLPEYTKFLVDEQKHSQELAVWCLRVPNRELREDLPCVGYLVKDDSEPPGVPIIGDHLIPEALRYACRFWIDHVLDMKVAVSRELVEQLQVLMETKAVLWIEAMAAKGTHRGL
ncbi:hypothetical protein BDV93DRAFT_563933 [Ceratobasidium sp. AG-I]|nr:hypothetical protein BDV93DRAFT_563933 [Ceratobasidium sp. AG-I]